MIKKNEQWKTDGICAKCRRVNYCGRTCTAAKRHTDEIIKKAYWDTMYEKYPELADMIENTAGEMDFI